MIPFISTEDLNSQLGTTVDEDDLRTIIALDAACQLVRDDIRQRVNLTENEVIWLDGSGVKSLILPELPVIAVTSIEEDGEEIDSEDYVVDQSGIVWRTEGGVWRGEHGCNWSLGHQNIKVTLTSGWALSEADVADATDDARAIERVPSSIRLVALNAAARIYRMFGTDSAGAKTSENFGVYSYSTSEGAAELARTMTLTALEQVTLNRWRQPS